MTWRWTWRACAIAEGAFVLCGTALWCAAPSPSWQQPLPAQPQTWPAVGWAPPNTDAKIPKLSKAVPCDLSKMLEQAGGRAVELSTNLERFAAQETIEYKRTDFAGVLKESGTGTFNYTFAFEEVNGGRTTREYRAPAKGSHLFPGSEQDTGQVALALIFLPDLQTDYEMSCEGLDSWSGQATWVVHFRQRKDKPSRTLQYVEGKDLYPAKLKGRAWISRETAEIVHLETNLMEALPGLRLQTGAISIDYAPITVKSRSVTLWLPERIAAFWEFRDYRVMLVHSFRQFEVFTVETEEKIQTPKEN
jgi:hypothetical protein